MDQVPPLRWSSSHQAAVTDFKLPELFRKQVLTVFFFLSKFRASNLRFYTLVNHSLLRFLLDKFLTGLKI